MLYIYEIKGKLSRMRLDSVKSTINNKTAKQQTLLHLSEAYFLVLENGELLETVQAEKKAMCKYLEFSEKKHQSGIGRKADVEESIASYLNALSKEVGLKNRLLDSRYALRESLGSMSCKLSKPRPKIDLKLPVPSNSEEWVSKSAQNNLNYTRLNCHSMRLRKKEKSFVEATISHLI